MSNVINIQNWKAARLKSIRELKEEAHLQRNWRGRVHSIIPSYAQEIIDLLNKAHELHNKIPSGATVIDRETLAIKSLECTMRAHSLAKANGYAIVRYEDEHGNHGFNINPTE